MVVREGEASIPVAYRDWAEWRDLQALVNAFEVPAAPPAMEFCAVCWGAGRHYEAARNGEGLVPRACGTCGGVGAVPARPGPARRV